MRPFAMMRLALRWAELCGLALLLCACAATPSRTAPPPPAAVTTPIAAPANIDSTALTPGAAPGQKTPSAQVKTRNALFKPSSFAELPGWRQDDLDTAWDALLASCKALSKREAWQTIAKQVEVAFSCQQRRLRGFQRAIIRKVFALTRILAEHCIALVLVYDPGRACEQISIAGVI